MSVLTIVLICTVLVLVALVTVLFIALQQTAGIFLGWLPKVRKLSAANTINAWLAYVVGR